jgi:hypothetical protein
MDTPHPQLPDLFDQLGLPSDAGSIRRFITHHRPLDSTVRVFEAPIWSPSQAAFLREKHGEDGNWAIAIDTLNAALHEHPDAEAVAASDSQDSQDAKC